MDYFIYLNIVYFLFAFFLIYPPNEIISLGFSIPTLFSSMLGSEQMHFIHYHMVRILITISIHSLLPLGYYLFIGFFSETSHLFDIGSISSFWRIYLSLSILFAVTVLTLVYYWKMNNFCNHPVGIKLCNLSRGASSNEISWQSIASQINIEFRRIEKFSAGTLYSQVYVTDTYLIKIGLYTIHVCLLQNADLTLTHTNEFKLTQEGGLGTQYLNIAVKPRRIDGCGIIPTFSLRLNSFEYKEFNDKLYMPVIDAAQVVIKQSLPEQFLDAFRLQINENESCVIKAEDVDTCIGCMRKTADIKLQKTCDASDCKECFCKPMWCLECLGKWFAYRQDQSQPNTWLSSKATCATCRAKFCLLDIAPLNITD